MTILPLILVASVLIPTSNFSFADSDYFAGEIMWDDANFHNLLDSFAKKIQVTDHDMNQNSTKTEKITVDIWSDTDPKGITVSAYETGKNTGIFESVIYFAQKPSVGQRISVNVGDEVTARYTDQTVNGTKKLETTDTMVVKGFERQNDGNFHVDDPDFARQHLQTGKTIPNAFATHIVEGLGAGLIILFIIVFAIKKKRMRKKK